MPESFERPADVPQENPEDALKKERIENVVKALTEAEDIFEAEGREKAKLLLPKIYNEMIALNKRDKEKDWDTVLVWNPEGAFTQEEFEALNLRRKLLSNAIGVMTASGEVRHDLNKI